MTDHLLLRGAPLRKKILNEVGAKLRELEKRHVIGRLVSICIGQNDGASIYIRNQMRAAKKVGIPFEKQFWHGNISQGDCKERIAALNDDSQVVGVILQRPTPEHINLRSLQSAIHPLKDVEGMNPASVGNIVYNDLALAPCTAAASIELLRQTGLRLEGLEVVMIGHSEIVGKPVAFMLMAEGATVTVCHHLTRSLAAHSRQADVVIVAVGKPKLIRADMIKPGAAVIDIGINQVVDETEMSRSLEMSTQKVFWKSPVG